MKTIEFSKTQGKVDVAALHQWLDRCVKYLTNGGYTMSVTRKVKRRSNSQNALMWLWFHCIETETGQPSRDIHDYYCHKFLSREILDPMTGEVVKVDGHTSTLNTQQMSRFMDEVQADAATEMGITLPLPEDLGYEDFVLQYKNSCVY